MLRYTVVFASIASIHALLDAPAVMPLHTRTGRSAIHQVLTKRGGMVVADAVLAPPAAGFEGAVAAGEKKANMPANKIFGLGVLSGCHIAFGAFLMLSVGGACPGLAASNPGLQKIILGAFGLPFGLMMTLLSGAELFTGNTALVTMALLEGKATQAQMFKSWTASYAGNFAGSLLLAALVFFGNTLAGGGASIAVSAAKTSLTFTQAVVRGILCNWLVCMAVYLASFAKDAAGKMVRSAMILNMPLRCAIP